MGEPPSAAIAGETNAAAENAHAIVQANDRRDDCVGIPDIGSSSFDPSLYSRREKVTNAGAKIRARKARGRCLCRCRGGFADARARSSPI
jgi:hypothetical protein